MPDALAALTQLKRLLARDPVLRDVLHQAVPGLDGGPFVPAVDVIDTQDAHLIRAELPGVKKEALKIRVDGAHLVLEGEKGSDHPEGSTARSTERAFGAFRRSFLLPPDADGESVKARFEDGVLTVTVPKRGPRGREVPLE